ncbi:MAG: radical SAM protein [Desulfovibrionaceae bacterium]
MHEYRTEDDPLNPVYESKEYKTLCRKQDLDICLLVDVEVSAHCNLDCIMCTRQIGVERPIGNMTPEVFHRVVDQAAEAGVKLMRFSGYGEVLVNKHFIDYLAYAKSKGLLTHLTTNGHLLDEKTARAVVELGLDKIKFSFQGTDEAEYNRMRNTDKYWLLVENIVRLRRIRTEMDRKLPVIQVATTVLDETDEQIQDFHDFWAHIADLVYHLPTVTWRLEDTEFGKEHADRCRGTLLDKMCIEPATKLSVWNDGAVSGCCGDHFQQLHLGHLKDQTLQEIWDDEPARKLRALLRKKTPATFNAEDKAAYPLCAQCMSMNINRSISKEESGE